MNVISVKKILRNHHLKWIKNIKYENPNRKNQNNIFLAKDWHDKDGLKKLRYKLAKYAKVFYV